MQLLAVLAFHLIVAHKDEYFYEDDAVESGELFILVICRILSQSWHSTLQLLMKMIICTKTMQLNLVGFPFGYSLHTIAYGLSLSVDL